MKRIDDVVHTFFGISQKIPAKLILIGDGPERQKAEDLGRLLGIVDRLIFLGRTREVRRVLAVSDLFLLPSEKESFGLAALEAMAAVHLWYQAMQAVYRRSISTERQDTWQTLEM